MASHSQDRGLEGEEPIPPTLSPQDIIIPIMGITGFGKSKIISLCTDEPVRIGDDLYSCQFSLQVQPISVPKYILKWMNNGRYGGTHHV